MPVYNGRGLADLATGTVSVAAGATALTFSGVALMGVDPGTGATIYYAGRGDWIQIGAFAPVMIASVDSATTATLAATWPNATQTAASYAILRYSNPPTGSFAKLWQDMLAIGGDASPDTSRTIDNGVIRAKLRGGASGRAEIAVGPSGTADASLKPALQINPTTGVVSAPYGFGSGLKPGMRNLLRNPGFQINQRTVSGTVTLAAGNYGHDGVKAGAAGATYTFVEAGADVQITVTAGSIILPVEANMIDGGSYVLSHEGAAQARVWQGAGATGSGAYAPATRATPLVVAGLTANTQTNIEFSTGTVLKPQFEPGVGVTDYDRRGLHDEWVFCRRFFRAFTPKGLSGVTLSATSIMVTIALGTPMRAAPTLMLPSVDSPTYTWLVGSDGWAPQVMGTLALASPTATADGIYAPIEGFTGLPYNLPVNGNGVTPFLYANAEI